MHLSPPFHSQERINDLPEGYVFVFGSNLAGRHGAGAALIAYREFNAKYGKGDGIQPKLRSYAFPTLDENIGKLPEERLRLSFHNFLDCLLERQNLMFVLTNVGVGLAGYPQELMVRLFWETLQERGNKLPQNVILPIQYGVTDIGEELNEFRQSLLKPKV